MARISTTGITNALTGVFPAATTFYLALFTSDPGTTGASGEVTGGSYARQSFNFNAATAGSQTGPAVAVNFTGMPAESSVSQWYYGVFTAATGGTYIAGGLLSGLPSALSAGATISFATNSLTNTWS